MADRPPQGVLYLRPHVWRKRGIEKELQLVSNADAVTQAKAIVVKLERSLSGQDVGTVSSKSRGAARTFTNRGQGDTGVLRTLRGDSFKFSTARAITHRTPQKAELFCEIRMMR